MSDERAKEVARLKAIAEEKRAEGHRFQLIADIFKNAARDYFRQAVDLERASDDD